MGQAEYLAVIFSSELAGEDPAYAEAATRMERLSSEMPGFRGTESFREGARGVTISYWDTEQAILAWRNHPEHLDVQSRGRAEWYRRYTLRVARVFRESTFEVPS